MMPILNLARLSIPVMAASALPAICSCSQVFPNLTKAYTSAPLYSGKPNAEDDFYASDGTVKADGLAFISLLREATTDSTKRNELIDRVILASDRISHETIAKILLNQTGSNLAFGSLTNIFSGVATVISPTTTKTVFSAAAGLSNASRSLVNEEVYRNALATAVVRKIDQKRELIRARIKINMAKTIEEYSVHEALADLNEYHNSASFSTGMTEVVTDSFRTPSLTEQVILLEDMKKKVTGSENIDALNGQIETLIKTKTLSE